MPSKNYLMLRSAQRACPRLELGARLEARTCRDAANFLTTAEAGVQRPSRFAHFAGMTNYLHNSSIW
jgi:hypothetical protein